MAKKLNNTNVEDISKLSQYSPDQVLRDAHDLPGHSLRVRDALSVVPQYYTHFDAQYNGNGQPTLVIYYAGTCSEISQVVTKEAATLNNKYFFLFEGRSNKSFYIWFSVDGLGVDPAIPSSTGIQIDLDSSDPAIIVANAIEITLNSLYSDKWKVTRKNAVLEITAVKSGETNNIMDGNTTFLFSTLKDGAQEEVARVEIDYSNNGDPIYEGEVLRGHTFNIFTGKFDKNEVEVTLINEQGDSLLVFDDIVSLAQGAVGTILTYTVPVNSKLKLRRSNISGCNMGTYEIKVNGTVVDRVGTYYTDYNSVLEFDDVEYSSGTIITIEVLNRGEGSANFNANLQGRLLDV